MKDLTLFNPSRTHLSNSGEFLLQSAKFSAVKYRKRKREEKKTGLVSITHVAVSRYLYLPAPQCVLPNLRYF